jgi:hypothetical protein
MKHRIIFGILKTYSGILTKRHIGNVQLIIIEMSKEFLMFNVIGQDVNNQYIAQQLVKGPSEHVNEFIDKYEEDGKFIQIEEILCDIPIEDDNKFKVILKKKGKHLNSHYTFTLAKELSSGWVKVYTIDGKFTPLVVEKTINNSEIKMKILKKQAIVKPILNQFIASIKR